MAGLCLIQKNEKYLKRPWNESFIADKKSFLERPCTFFHACNFLAKNVWIIQYLILDFQGGTFLQTTEVSLSSDINLEKAKRKR